MRIRRPKGLGATTNTLLIALVLVLLNYAVTLPYFVVKPGRAIDVDRFVELPAEKAHPTKGQVLLTTVSLVRARPTDIVRAWVTPNSEIRDKQEVLGTGTQQQYTERSREDMDDSQRTAIAVAMRRAGYDVKVVGEGAGVREVNDNSPATSKLNPNDLIVGVNDRPVSTGPDLTAFLRTVSPGTSVNLKVRDDKGAERQVEIVTGFRPNNTPGAYLGISIETKNPKLETPFPVTFGETKIGGPSAGLAFTLTLLDELTPGELTGGKKVATTGTINIDGTVGPVGGVRQKTQAVKGAGVKIFLVPSDEVEEAKRYAGGDLTVLPVDNLDQAISALASNGGDASGIAGPQAQRPAA